MTGISIDETPISCGVHYISGMQQNPATVIREVKGSHFEDRYDEDDNEIYSPVCAFYIFSDTVNSGGAKSLAQYIKKNKLGDVVGGKSKMNPNSKNAIQVYTWRVNDKNLLKWNK